MTRSETLTDRIQHAIDHGATRVEDIHKSIAELPFEVMQRNGLFEKTAADLRDLQDRSIGAVYDVIRDVNRQVTDFAGDLLGQRDGSE